MPQVEYTETYTTFTGSDIVPIFGGRVIGECQAITYSVTREKAPVYVMGSPDPRSFSRGKRGIAGSLVFTVFDRDSFIEEMSKRTDSIPNLFYTARANTQMRDIVSWDEVQSAEDYESADMGRTWETFRYADQIPPFDITITFGNEYGQTAVLIINQVEILNQGMGFSIDDMSTEQACTFVARGIQRMRAGKLKGGRT